jgi:hypothetical protein
MHGDISWRSILEAGRAVDAVLTWTCMRWDQICGKKRTDGIRTSEHKTRLSGPTSLSEAAGVTKDE